MKALNRLPTPGFKSKKIYVFSIRRHALTVGEGFFLFTLIITPVHGLQRRLLSESDLLCFSLPTARVYCANEP
jgi:hypothetical protein